MTNRYAAPCTKCGLTVPPEQGDLKKVDGEWVTTHLVCPTDEQVDAEAAAPTTTPASSIDPTPEQVEALILYATGESLLIEAGAGTGKTSTVRLLAESTPDRNCAFMAFNRAIVEDAKDSFPRNVTCRTVHGWAFAVEGRRFAARLRAPRQTSTEIARLLRVDPYYVTFGTERKVLQPGFLAGQVLRALQSFCQSEDEAPSVRHFQYIDGIDLPTADGRRTYAHNDKVREALMPALTRAWVDWQDPNGQLRYDHDAYVKCQPAGTMVRRTRRVGPGYEVTEVPIEEVREGDRVVTWSAPDRLGGIRRSGRRVSHVAQRDYEGTLVTVRTDSGTASSYTHDHICVAVIGDSMDDEWVVYLMRSGDNYRVGRVAWRYGSQNNTIALNTRIREQRADAVWVLSAHSTETEAALAEALTAHQFGIPGWQFHSRNEAMPLDQFWAKAGANWEAAAKCVAAFGRSLVYPLWEKGDRPLRSRVPVLVRACNLMDGMRVCEADRATPDARGIVHTGGWTGCWTPVEVTRTPFSGAVYSIEVEQDHTYVADGIVTHNCFALGEASIPVETIFVDEAQDLSGVMVQILRKNQARGVQVVCVGDPAQTIYEWRGSVSVFDEDYAAMFQGHTTLTQSFRFGQPIAEVANLLLANADAGIRLIGNPDRESTVGGGTCNAVLTRTNAKAVETMFEAMTQGRTFHLVGGGKEVSSFARGAQELQLSGRTSHPELACFTSWQQVVDYVADDPSGEELKLMVGMVEQYTAERIIDALSRQARVDVADLVVSTTHKSKGLQFGRVRLAGDFPDPGAREDARSEWRLLYVAATRAKFHLDYTACGPVLALVEPAEEDEAPPPPPTPPT